MRYLSSMAIEPCHWHVHGYHFSIVPTLFSVSSSTSEFQLRKTSNINDSGNTLKTLSGSG